MPLNKPNIGQKNWGPVLNDALDYLDTKSGTTGPAGAAGPTGPAGATGPIGPAGEGSAADIADFVFDTVEEPDYESTMTVTNNDMVIKTVVNTEASGNIRIESAQNLVLNAEGSVYLGDVSFQDNRIATIGDVQAASTAGFVFTAEEGQSTISLPGDRQMRIQAGEDSDLYLTAGDDLYIQTLGSGDDIHVQAADDIRFTAGIENTLEGIDGRSYGWTMNSEGELHLPETGYVSNPYATIATPSNKSAFYTDNYLNDQSGIINQNAVFLPVDADSLWFADNFYSGNLTSPVTITFADTTTAPLVAVYDATSQGTPAVIFQWDDMDRTKTFEETYPLTVYVDYTVTTYDGSPTIVLDPANYGNDQKLVVDVTAPNHVHLRAGGAIDRSTAEIFLGGEETHVRVTDSSGSVEILGTDITINSYAVPSSLNINTYSGAVVNSARTSGYDAQGKIVATLGDIDTAVSPVDTTFTVVGGTLGTQPTFDGAPLFTGSYVRAGAMVHFRIDVNMDNITNFGTGQYYVDLPFPAKYNYHFRDACLHDNSGTVRQYALSGHVYEGQSQVTLWFTATSGQDEAFDYNSPALLTVADNFHLAGTYIADTEAP